MDTLSGSRSIPVGRDAPSSSSFFGVVVGVCGLLLAPRVWGWWCGGLFVICIVVVSILFVLWFCLVLLGIRWMPWHQELMKDVAACDYMTEVLLEVKGVTKRFGGFTALENVDLLGLSLHDPPAELGQCRE